MDDKSTNRVIRDLSKIPDDDLHDFVGNIGAINAMCDERREKQKPKTWLYWFTLAGAALVLLTAVGGAGRAIGGSYFMTITAADESHLAISRQRRADELYRVDSEIKFYRGYEAGATLSRAQKFTLDKLLFSKKELEAKINQGSLVR